jgi:Leucine-rich repeat (LRR) protein
MNHRIPLILFAALGLVSCAEQSPWDENGRRIDFDVPALTDGNAIGLTFIAVDNSLSVEIGLDGGRIAVDWGDGTPVTKDRNPSRAGNYPEADRRMAFRHTYAAPGEYRIRIWSAELVSLNAQGSEAVGFTDLRAGVCPALEYLDCSRNRLTTLDLSGCTALKTLNCGWNEELSKLDLEGCGKIEWLDFSASRIVEFDFGAFPLLKHAVCEYSGLYRIDVSRNPLLEYLACAGQSWRLMWPDGDPGLPAGFEFDITGTPLLEYLDCTGNELTALNISGRKHLRHLNVRNNRLDKKALEEIFLTLPDFQKTRANAIPRPEPPLMRIFGNPGARTCDTQNATVKGWTVE